MRIRRRQWQIFAVVVGLTLVAAACGSDKKSSNAGTGSGSSSSSASGSSSSGGGADKAGALAGMKGTTPLVDLGADIKASLDAQGIDNKKTYNYGAESHDAVVV